MPESVLVRLADAHVRSFGEEVDAAQRLTDQAQLDQRIEELIAAQRLVPDELENVQSFFQEAAGHEAAETQVWLGRLYDGLVAQWANLTTVLELLVIEKVRDPRVKARGLRELPAVSARLKAIRDKIWREWQWFSEEDAERARAAEIRGGLIAGDEVFAGVAGVDVPEWRRRVEARKARSDS